jgi:O-antigen/teichoic acid export membrane protein
MKLFSKLTHLVSYGKRSSLIKNSLWGISSNIGQNILFSLFFIILARAYSRADFANYIIANSLYGMVVSLSSLGLGQWFIREVISISDKRTFISQYFKLQFLVGATFYFLHILLAYSLYEDHLIRSLSLLLGINIVFDNIIYVIKHVNVAEENQRKTFYILTIEAILKFIAGCFLFIAPMSIFYLSILLIGLRLITLNLFMHYGSSGLLSFSSLFTVKIEWRSAFQIVRANWSFIIIGSLSVIYWRLGNIFVSKFLEVTDVADYEVSFKLFSIAEILPFIVSTSLFPIMVKAFQQGPHALRTVYRQAFLLYSLYGLLAYTFVVSYSDLIIPRLFGASYQNTFVYCNQMFLTILVFPTALLQANIMVSMKLEKIDMWLNLISLTLHVLISLLGLYYLNSLSVISYSIFFSFIVFHLLQDFYLIRKGVISFSHVVLFYLISTILLVLYFLSSLLINIHFLFPIYWSVILFSSALFFIYLDRRGLYKFKLVYSA